MHSTSYLYACYYDHGCSIMPQKDVLEIDIPGHSIKDSLRRWWYDLFLLSFTDERCRRYYTSTHSMRMERVRQYRRHSGRIHPLSKFRNTWDCLMIFVFSLNIIALHHNSSPILGQFFSLFYYVAVVFEILTLLDLIVNMKTGYVDEESRKIVFNGRKVLVNYCSTKLFLHFVSAIPLQMFLILRLGDNIDCDRCKLNLFIYTLRIFNGFRLYRVYEASAYLTRERSSAKLTYCFKFFRICLTSFVTIMVYNSLHETISLWIMEKNGKVDLNMYYGLILYWKYVLENSTNELQFLAMELSKIWKSLLLFSFGFKHMEHPLDRLSFIGTFWISTVFHMWCLIESYAFLHQIKYADDRMLLMKKASLTMVHCKQLPDKVCAKISKYFTYKNSWIREVETKNALYANLPSTIKKEVMLTCYRKYIRRVRHFSQWPIDIIEDLVMLLQQNIYLTNDIVTESGVQGDGLIILECGMMAVYSAEGVETGHLIDGDYFGELSLVTDKEVQLSHVVAISPCKILILEKVIFRKYMRDHPHLFFEMRQQLRDTHNTHLSSN